MSVKVKYANECMKEYAISNLNETEENVCNAVEDIKNWINNTPGLNAKTDDKSILAFLRGCKFNLEPTKKKMKNFYVMKLERTEWFLNRDPYLTEISELIDLGVFVPLNKYHNNMLVVIIRTAAHDPKVHKQDNVFKAGKMILDLAIEENFDNATIYGVCAIFDMSGISLPHARQLPPHVIKKAVFAWQNYYCRPKQLEFINAPMYGRVKVHFSGNESLHKVVAKEILPVEYGGCNGTLADLIQYWGKKVREHKDWFKNDEQYRAEFPL
ncbi:hypothetical protein FQR65_LT13075 [Abscondita terminalis]|nr:hypothetical protein FQR65_LT13075 [Abscondita terminalis]